MNACWWFALGGLLAAIAGVLMVLVRERKTGADRGGVDDTDRRQFDGLARELVHEIRNPLNSINLNLQLLEEDLSATDNRPDDLRQRVQRVRGEVERLDRILDDFRRYAKLPAPAFEICNLGVLITEVLDFNEPEAQRQNVEVIRDIRRDLPPIRLDREQFKQALLNLIINANQAMEDGGKLAVRAQRLNGQIRIDVEDTGDGIPPDQLERIFELFFSTKREGTGVGLTIVKKVVEGHGGRVTVNSRANLGATFSIFLPAP